MIYREKPEIDAGMLCAIESFVLDFDRFEEER